MERLMDGGNAADEVQGGETYPYGAIDRKSEQYQAALHELMVPYYDMYLNGDFRLCKPNMEAIRWRMKDVIEEDEQFGTWASEQDLIVSAEGWGKNMQRIQETKRIYQYFYMLQLLLEKDCRQDWQALSLELKEMLFKAEAYSDYKTDEVSGKGKSMFMVTCIGTVVVVEPDRYTERLAYSLYRVRKLFEEHDVTQFDWGADQSIFYKAADTASNTVLNVYKLALAGRREEALARLYFRAEPPSTQSYRRVRGHFISIRDICVNPCS